MKILLFHYDELDTLGGVESLVRTMSLAFTEMGHPAGVLELGDAWADQRALYPGVPLWRIASSTFPKLRRPRSWFSYGRCLAQFLKVIKMFDPDVVHVHFPVHQALPVVGAFHLPHRWKLAVTVHNSDIRGEAQKDPVVRLWRSRLFDRADVVTAVSDSLLEEAKSDYPVIGYKGRVIYNGVDMSWASIPDGPVPFSGAKYVLYAGRLHKVKGVDTLISAWHELRGYTHNRTLLIVGDGPQRESLERQVSEMGLSETVEFIPAQGREELARLYRNAECLVLPSRREGLAMVLLEAGACGAICVASDVTGIREIIKSGQNGLLFSYGDHVALARALMSVFNMSGDKRHAMKTAAQRRVAECFTQDNMVRKYLDLYSEITLRAVPADQE